MPAGNSACLHGWLEDFAQYDEFDIELGGEEATIYHSQFAKYPITRAVTAVYNNLTFDPSEYDEYNEFRDAYFDSVYDESREALKDIQGVTVGLHDERHFDAGSYVKPMDMSEASTDLITMYDGFEPDEDDNDPYERYGKTRDVPETKAQLVADLFTMYHVNLAEREHISPLRFMTYSDDWTEKEANLALFGMRDAIERQHGWSVFDVPAPSLEVIKQIWEMMEYVGFDPDIRWVYSLYISRWGAKKYTPDDATDRSVSHSMGRAMSGMMRDGSIDMKYTAEGRTPAELEEHRDKMLKNHRGNKEVAEDE